MARNTNVATVRALWDAWTRAGIDGMLALAPPDVEWRPSVAEGEPLRGAQDMRAFFKAREARGEHIEAEIEDIEEIGDDAVLVTGRLRRTNSRGTAIDEMAWLYAFRDGSLWRASAHRNAEEARQAARFVSSELGTSERQPVLSVAEGRDEDGNIVISLRGELDLATAPVVEEAVTATAGPGRTIRLDLRRLVFLDSTGMRTLIQLHRAAIAGGWTLRIVRASNPVQRIFLMSGMEKVLPFEQAEQG